MQLGLSSLEMYEVPAYDATTKYQCFIDTICVVRPLYKWVHSIQFLTLNILYGISGKGMLQTMTECGTATTVHVICLLQNPPCIPRSI